MGIESEVYAKSCRIRIFYVKKLFRDTYFPVLTASKVYFRQTNNSFNLGSDITDYNKWVKVSNELFFIPELRESDLVSFEPLIE